MDVQQYFVFLLYSKVHQIMIILLCICVSICFLQSALGDEMFFANGMAYDEYDSGSGEECVTHGPGCNSGRDEKPNSSNVKRSSSFKETVTNTINEWSPYGIAALTVGIGLAYSYMKT